MEKDIKKSAKLTLLVGVLMLIVIATSTTYAYFKTRIKSPGSKISVTGSNFSLNITDNALTASGLKPIYDKNKSTQAVKKEFTISIGSDGITSACYDLYIDIESLGSNLRNKYFKYEITNGTDTYAGNFSGRTDGSQILIMRNQNINTTNTSNSYTLYLWLAYGDNDDSQGELLTGDATSRTYKGRILAKAATGSCKETDTDPTMYSVNLLVINGISDKSSQEIIKGKSATFNITPNDGYTLENASISCSNGTLSNNLLTISNVQNDVTCTITLGEDGPFKKGTLAYQILQDNPTVSTRTDFITNIGDTTGTIYVQSSTSTSMMTEDIDGDGIGEDVYYYSGYTTNNFVKFAKRGNNDLYWRIIRTNEDRSVRMLYYGYGSGSTIYYGTGGIDQLKGSVISGWNNSTNYTWYENYLLNDYDKYISKTAIYCLDRSIGEKVTNTNYYYGASKRGYTSPTYKCGGNGKGGLFESAQRLNDKFSASTSGGGNGQLKYPIALINADEIAYAGKMSWHFKDHENNFLGDKDFWWTMSLGQHKSDYMGIIRMCTRRDAYDGLTETDNVYYGYIFPVISLKACVKYSSGDGSSTNPYQVTIDSTCETAEN